MGDAAALDGVAQRLYHRVLPDQLGEGLRPIFAGQHPVMQVIGRFLRLFGEVQPKAGRFVVVHHFSV